MQQQKIGFQFHKGTIRTTALTTNASSPRLNFNSIKVRLEHLRDSDLYRFYSDFNSIKVRLEHGTLR